MFRRLNVEKPEARLVRNSSEDAPKIADRRFCLQQKLATESRKEQSLLTLHARGYSVESNSLGSRYICIPSKEEDKLNQHLTSIKPLLDLESGMKPF